jgi:uncharacterized membrane protein
MNFEEYQRYNKLDMVKDILLSFLMLVILSAYWMGVMLLLSLVLVNVWRVAFTELAVYAAALTVISFTIYCVRLVRKRRKGIF